MRGASSLISVAICSMIVCTVCFCVPSGSDARIAVSVEPLQQLRNPRQRLGVVELLTATVFVLGLVLLLDQPKQDLQVGIHKADLLDLFCDVVMSCSSCGLQIQTIG